MASLVPCPHCGIRPKEEFTIRGDAAWRALPPSRRRTPGSTTSIYATIRAGGYEEYWHHTSGCRRWLVVDARHRDPCGIRALPMPRSAKRGGDGMTIATVFPPAASSTARKPLNFTFDGRQLTGHAGDTLASALLANGLQLVGRSFKYHRPRGILTAGAAEPNALVTIGSGGRTEPNTPRHDGRALRWA